MTDPERISKRSSRLGAQLLQAGAAEEPHQASVQRTLAALGISAAVVSASTSAAGAVTGAAKASGVVGAGGAGVGAVGAGGGAKAVSATLLAKWIGIGVVSGVGLAGAAAVVSSPSASAPSAAASRAAAPPQLVPVQQAMPLRAAPPTPTPGPSVQTPSLELAPASATPAPRANADAAPPASASEVGALLAAEVAYIDRARALLSSGRSDEGLALLRGYEREFPEARLLPEALFLRLETCDRLGRKAEARAAAQRLLAGFPQSPHAARARKALAGLFP